MAGAGELPDDPALVNRSLAVRIVAGYAVVATDTGHQADPSASHWALGPPEKVADCGHRSIHLTTGAQAFGDTSEILAGHEQPMATGDLRATAQCSHCRRGLRVRLGVQVRFAAAAMRLWRQ